MWTYVRDERGHSSAAQPAMLFRYAPDRKGERPAAHLARFRGDLHADGYAGFDRLYGERMAEVAREALDHIAGLYAVEQEVRGQSPTSDDASAGLGPDRCSTRSADGSTPPAPSWRHVPTSRSRSATRSLAGRR